MSHFQDFSMYLKEIESSNEMNSLNRFSPNELELYRGFVDGLNHKPHRG